MSLVTQLCVYRSLSYVYVTQLCVCHSAGDLDVICNRYQIIYFCPIYIIWMKSDKLVEFYRPLLDGVEIKLCQCSAFCLLRNLAWYTLLESSKGWLDYKHSIISLQIIHFWGHVSNYWWCYPISKTQLHLRSMYRLSNYGIADDIDSTYPVSEDTIIVQLQYLRLG